MSDKKKNLAALLFDNYHVVDPETEKERWVFNSAGFYQSWFREGESQPYFFLFRKNLAVTNLQFGELLSLLRTYTTVCGQDTKPNLQFLSTTEFNQKVYELLVALTGEADNDERNILDRCDKFEKYWGNLLERSVVIDAFYGSCVVFFPPKLHLDLKAVCATSGYIHSCGPSIWARKVRKAKPDEMIEKLGRRLPNGEGPRSTFAVYSHEDFTEFDREQASDLRHGLDDVKVWVAKYWMGTERLVSVLNRLSDEVPRLEVAGPGDYRAVRKLMSERNDVDMDRCFWLIVDRAVAGDGVHAGQERTYHCYEQHYCNGSPFHTFEENKPAWRAHTTLPHTLTGAMLNLTRPYWPEGKELRLLDPFVGTGTTLFEAAKFPNLRAEGVDHDPIVPLLVDDNLRFFTSTAEELEALRVYLAQVIAIEEERGDRAPADVPGLFLAKTWLSWQEIEGPELRQALDNEDRNVSAHAAYERAEHKVRPITINSESDWTMDAKDADALREDWSLPERFLFYVGLRAVRRNVGGRERGDERARYRLAWLSEAKVLVRQIEQVVERYSKASISDKDDAVRVFPGFYSLECSVSPDFLGRLGERTDLARCGNALDLEEDSAFDLIITDPPYGFNTAAHSEHLAALYCDFIRRALKSLRDQGQLVIALPDQSFIGREPAFFANRKFVERQVTALAHELDLELVSSSEVVPASPPIYNAPYYWESERALRRSIIHYRIGSRAAVRERNDKAVTARI